MIFDIDITTIQHILVSVWLMVVSNFLIRNKMVCVLIVMSIGLGKEIIDPLFNVMDFVGDLVGIAIGYYIMKWRF